MSGPIERSRGRPAGADDEALGGGDEPGTEEEAGDGGASDEAGAPPSAGDPVDDVGPGVWAELLRRSRDPVLVSLATQARTGGTFDAITGTFDSSEVALVAWATDALARDPRPVPFLTRLLEADRPDLRRSAAAGLATYAELGRAASGSGKDAPDGGEPAMLAEAIRVLRRAIRDEDPAVAGRASLALVGTGELGPEHAVGALDDERAEVRRRALAVLAASDLDLGPIAVALALRVRDDDWSLRRVARRLLERLAAEAPSAPGGDPTRLLCVRCLTHARARETRLGWLRRAVWNACRVCDGTRCLIAAPGGTELVLDEGVDAPGGPTVEEDGVIRRRWSSDRPLGDFDRVAVRGASDADVESLAIAAGNDEDRYRRGRFPEIPVRIEPGCALADNSLEALRRTFGQVAVAAGPGGEG